MNLNHLNEIIKAYKPLKDIDTIVIETNKIFHKYDAQNYDNEHPEIFEGLPPIYTAMCDLLPKDEALRVLNFGCGTGFEAGQLFNNVSNIEHMYCYDLSNEMLEKCKQKLNKWGKRITFCNNIKDIPNDALCNVLVTNSLLHHLPYPMQTIAELQKLLSANAFYIMGHEDSARYYNNKILTEYHNEKNNNVTSLKREGFLAKNIRRILTPGLWAYYIKTIFTREKNHGEISPYHPTALAVVEAGLFEIVPPIDVIIRLVDCHVPMGVEGIGFDFKALGMEADWELIFSKTYNFLNDRTPFGKLSESDKKQYKLLEEQYPDDGLNFCCVWKRRGNNK